MVKKVFFGAKLLKFLILEPYYFLMCFSEISAAVSILIIYNVEIYSGDFGASPAMFRQNWNSYESGFGNPAQVPKFALTYRYMN